MTTTTVLPQSVTILEREFDIDELRDIALYGMKGGVSGFIYYHETSDKFDDHEDEIQDYLSDWVFDNIGEDESSFNYFAKECEDITQLKNKLVWAFVELKANEAMVSMGHPDFA